jgi:hypothetical protein
MSSFDDSTPEEQAVWHRAHVDYDHNNPPKNSRVPGLVQFTNSIFSPVLQIEWQPDVFVFRNKAGFECTAEMLFDLCGIMGLDPYEELPRMILEDAFKKV